MVYYSLLIFWTVVTILLWRQADRRSRRLPAGSRRIARALFGVFFGAMLVFVLNALARPARGAELEMPFLWAIVSYLWYPFVLQIVIGAAVAAWVCRRLTARWIDQPAEPNAASPAFRPPVQSPATGHLTRRDALAVAASAVGPLATLGLSGVALGQRGRFGVRRGDVHLATLPPDLDGVTIAHVTDVHAGPFFGGDAAARLADTVNSLRADLVVFTGDLIDRGFVSRLPIGMRLIDGLDRRHGFAMVEGNHDVQDEATAFERAMRDLSVPLLLDETMTVRIPGRSTPIQMLGLAWGPLEAEKTLLGAAPEVPTQYGRSWTLDACRAATRTLAAARDTTAFPILLGHHPHTVLAASEVGLPLVLAGHTHGGQLMLTDHIGAGPMRFKYWTGQDLVGPSRLVICNGVGGWFPLRVNAPAEVLHLTLRCAS